jgi:hypothetical protein
MLMAGKCIYQTNDPLVKVTPEYLYHAVKSPKPELENAVRQLRMVKNIDEKRYQMLKRDLPYVVTGIFYPSVRKTENFAWTNHFMADIDHLSVKETTPLALKEKLMADNRIMLMFASPGDDGLKILFKLNEKIYDSAKYSLFYKAFIMAFSKQYDLQQVADTRTSDVTRACFISTDTDAYYNSDAETVDPGNFLQFENFLDIKQLKTEIAEAEKEAQRQNPTITEKPVLEADALDKIKATLNPKFSEKKQKQIFVPEEAEKMVGVIIENMTEKEIITTEVISIHYGKKFRFALGQRQAEVNLFYGKKGYTAVIAPRNGTNAEFNQVCWQIISEMFL